MSSPILASVLAILVSVYACAPSAIDPMGRRLAPPATASYPSGLGTGP
jgi:hypothetical protein